MSVKLFTEGLEASVVDFGITALGSENQVKY